MRNGRYSALAVGFALAATSPALTAQQTKPSTATRVTVRGGTRTVSQPAALNKVCAELAASPSALVFAPEGRALLRFKKDLDGAAVAMETRGDPSERRDVQRMAEVRRGIDSLMQIIVSTMPDEHGRERTIVTMRREGGSMTPETRAALESRMARVQVEATIRSLEPQVAALMGSAVARGAVRIPMPTGWLGVTLSKSSRDLPSPEGMLTYNCEYPVIEAVHAGSPAEKGGLLAGDTLLAYNGRDVRADAVNMTKLLVPKHVVRVRVNRDGRQRELPITIAPRPDEPNIAFVRNVCPPGATRCEGPTFTIEMDTVRVRRNPGSVGGGSAMVGGMGGNGMGGSGVGASGGSLGRPGSGRIFVSSPVPPAMPVDAMLRGTGMAIIAGAQLSLVDDEFAQNMGIEPGVLVLRVLPGTPLAEVGVRPTDVIRAVNGVPLREMQQLHRAFASGTREVKLTVAGKGSAARVVTVRW